MEQSSCQGIMLVLGIAVQQPRESFREIAVKVHIRRPERDTWVYLGRGMVSQEIVGQSSRVGACPMSYISCEKLSSFPPAVVRAVSSQKIIAIFSEVSTCTLAPNAGLILRVCHKISDLRAEKRGNFVVIGCVEGSRVISWSLNVVSSFDFVICVTYRLLSCLLGIEQL